MRDYGKVSPQFWTGSTGKQIKAAGNEAVIVALYLMTSPHANMIGLYYLPKPYIAHETGLSFEAASKGLASCCEAMFCTYEDASEHVFVHAMARFQIADTLKPEDNRVKGVENELAKAPKGALLQAFMEIYRVPFSLKNESPFEAPSKPGAGTGAGKRKKALEQQAARKTASRFTEFWEAYPVKKGRADAETKWLAKGYDAIADTIIADVKRRIAGDRQWLDGYAPHGSTYINGRGWEDEIEPPKGANGSSSDWLARAV